MNLKVVKKYNPRVICRDLQSRSFELKIKWTFWNHKVWKSKINKLKICNHEVWNSEIMTFKYYSYGF